MFFSSIGGLFFNASALAATSSPQTQGLTGPGFQQGNGVEWFNTLCEGGGPAASGASTELTFPRGVDEGKMADVIDKWIEENKQPEGSDLSGVGKTAVESAKNANVNPFLVIAQAKYESEMASKNNYNVRTGHNAFGRAASESQPGFPSIGNPHVSKWYKWSSGEASVDYKATENQGTDSGDQYSYIRTVYSSELDAGDWGAYIEKYAPNTADGANASPIYHPADGGKSLVQQAVEEMMASAGGSSGGSGGSSSSTSSAGLVGDEPTEGEFAVSSGTNGHKRILVHTTEGDSSEVAKNALRANGTSYHTMIEKDGKELRIAKDDAIANGAKSSNQDSLHVALVGEAGDGSHFDPNSPQLQTLSKRLAKWASQYDIPLTKISGPGVLNSGNEKGVAGHGDVAKADPGAYADGPRSDPGDKFPWDKVLENAKNGGSSTSDGASQCCADTKTTSLAISGDTPVAKVMSYLTGKGLSVEIAAGFAGNFMQESGGGTFELDPTIVSPHGYKGIAQWDSSDRYPKLVSLKGDEADTIEGQIWYLGYELGLESDAGSGRYAPHLDRIKQNSDTVEDATRSVAKEYEGYMGELAERTEYAKKALDEYGDGKISSSSSSGGGNGCSDATVSGDFVYYNQNDPKWQGKGYNIALAGCGPTSISMIIATKKDKSVTPVEVTKFLSEKSMWSEAGGIQWSGFAAAGEKWGMTVTDIGKDWNKAKEALKAGKFMTLSGTGSEPFTSGGHIIVARGITDDGKIIIANSAPMTDTPEETPYTTAEIDGAGFANMWVFE